MAIQASIARTVQGASAVRVQGAGADAVLTGTVPNAAAAQQAEAIARGYVGDKGGVVDNLTVLGAIQVNVRVRIAEINRSVTRQLGFNWQALGSGPGWRFGLRTGAAVGSAITPLLPLGLAPLTGATAAPNQLGAGFISGNKLWDVNGVIDALAGDQLIRILAEPNLVALSGETASFLAGGEFPIPVADYTLTGAITVQFQSFGVSLAFTPTCRHRRGRDQPCAWRPRSASSTRRTLPCGSRPAPRRPGAGAHVRWAKTTIELRDGQSFSIAGLLQNTYNNSKSPTQMPWIGDVPVLGALFRSARLPARRNRAGDHRDALTSCSRPPARPRCGRPWTASGRRPTSTGSCLAVSSLPARREVHRLMPARS